MLLSLPAPTTEARLTLLQSAYTAQMVFGALEDAYRRPLQGDEGKWLSPPPQS